MTFPINTKNKPGVLKTFLASLFFVFAQTELLTLMSVLSQSFLTLVSRHFMSFFLFSAWHSFTIYRLITRYFFTSFTKVLAGLNAGIL